MTASIDFFRCMLRLPPHWVAWVAILMAANGIGSLFYITSIEGQITLAAMMLGAMIQTTIYARMGFVRLLGVGHLHWLLLVAWLWMRLDAAPPGSMFRNWMLAVIVVNSISLVIDIADIARYGMGDRAPQITLP